MISKLCGLIGHQRDRKRVRPYFETWRSKCVRCNVELMRDSRGAWQLLANRDDSLPPATYNGVRSRHRSRSDTSRSNSTASVLKCVHGKEHPVNSDLPQVVSTIRETTQQAQEFYLERADECRRRADDAADPSIKLTHLDMATRYEWLAGEAVRSQYG